MDLQSVLKALINARGYTYKTIGTLLGGKTTQAISDRLNKRSSMSVDTLLKFLDILGCELVIRDKNEKKDVWVITSSVRGGNNNGDE
jgi:transcriptional regulator with XRE-family HTH domain